jgi:hypothetical protein
MYLVDAQQQPWNMVIDPCVRLEGPILQDSLIRHQHVNRVSQKCISSHSSLSKRSIKMLIFALRLDMN